MKIAIVGHGFVGKAVDYGFPDIEKIIIDPKYDTKIEEFDPPDFAFICVPTPMSDTGEIDTSILESTLKEIRKYWTWTVVVVKSTVTPNFVKKFKMLDIYNPEFLTERAANDDFANPQFHVFGGEMTFMMRLKGLYDKYSICSPAPTFFMTAVEASIVKYTINSFLATKVTFFNEIYDLSQSHGANFQKISGAVGTDKRIGHSHSKVPGFDGKRGYGGSCFPKDVSAIIKSNDMPLLSKVHEINNGLRKKFEMDEREREQNVSFEK